MLRNYWTDLCHFFTIRSGVVQNSVFLSFIHFGPISVDQIRPKRLLSVLFFLVHLQSANLYKISNNTLLDHVGSNGEEITQIGHIVSEHQQCLVIVPGTG